MSTGPTTPIGWFLWQIKETYLVPASALAVGVLFRNLLVGVMTPVYVARLITNFGSASLSAEVSRIILVVVLAGMAEVLNISLKQVVLHGVRRELNRTFSALPKTAHLPWARFSGSITVAVDDFFSSSRDIMSVVFTQLPTLMMGFGGLIVVAFINGMVLMGIVSIVLSIAAPTVMYMTTKKVRPGIKQASATERSEREMLGAIFENYDMEIIAPILQDRRREYSEKAKKERNGTFWLVRRRTAEVQLINAGLVGSAVLMAVNYFHTSQNVTSSALIITIVLVLTGNLTLIHSVLDSIYDAQSRASGLTDVLKKRKVKPPMPPAIPEEDGMRAEKLSVTFTIENGGATQKKVVEFPSISLTKRDLICFSAESGRGKSTLFNIFTGCLDDYDGSARLGGYEVGEYKSTRIGVVKQELKKIDVPVASLFRLPELSIHSAAWERCHRILEWAGFSDVRMEQNISTLSGGERRRVLTACGLYWAETLRLDVIILDEPTNDLDVKHVEMLCEGLRAFSAANNMYVCVASHNVTLQEASGQVISW